MKRLNDDIATCAKCIARESTSIICVYHDTNVFITTHKLSLTNVNKRTHVSMSANVYSRCCIISSSNNSNRCAT